MTTDSDDTSFKGSDSKSEISLDSISENSSRFKTVSESLHLKKEITKKLEESSDKLSSDESDEDYSFEYDENDEKYEELIDKQMLKNSEEANMEYYHYLEKEKKDEIYNLTKEIYEYNGSNKPLRFKVIESDMDMKTKQLL